MRKEQCVDCVPILTKNYTLKGLALYNSLSMSYPVFRLCVICLDEESFNSPAEMKMLDILAFTLEDWEKYDPDPLVAKGNRVLMNITIRLPK